MKNLFKEFEKELINLGVVYESNGEYEQCASLEGIYEWGFTVMTTCRILPPVITFYDWEYQAMVSLDVDDYEYKIVHGSFLIEKDMRISLLNVYNGRNVFTYDLTFGAPFTKDSIDAIYKKDEQKLLVYANGNMSILMEGYNIIEVSDHPSTEDYELIPEGEYNIYLRDFNDAVIKQELTGQIV